MQTIYTSNFTSNFTQVSNTLLNSVIPAKAQKVLLYLLSKPSNWQLRFNDIKFRLGLSTYSTRQALRWLTNAGYLIYQRLKSGHTVWRVYDTPQAETPAAMPRVEIPHVENRFVLETLRQTEIQEQQPSDIPIITPEPIVVVSGAVISEIVGNSSPVSVDSSTDGLTYPDKLTKEQRKQAKHVIKKCKPELKQDVLFALGYAMVQGTVKNPVAYLQGLIKSANNGLFTPVEVNLKGKNVSTLTERLEIERKRKEEAQKRLKVDNNRFFQMLKEKYGHSSTL